MTNKRLICPRSELLFFLFQIAAFDEEENKAAMEKAMAEAAGNPQLMFATVMPLAMQIQGKVAVKYGFTPDQMGILQKSFYLFHLCF